MAIGEFGDLSVLENFVTGMNERDRLADESEARKLATELKIIPIIGDLYPHESDAVLKRLSYLVAAEVMVPGTLAAYVKKAVAPSV